MKIKIAYLVDDLKIGGLERSLAIVAENLDKTKYTVSVWCLIGAGKIAEELKSQGIEVNVFDFRVHRKIPFLFQLARRLKVERIKIAHCWGVSAGVWGRLAAIIAGVPVRIVHAQNLYADLSKKNRLYEYILGFFTHKVIACSEAVKKSLVKFTGIAESKITIIYNCAQLDKFSALENKESLRREFGLFNQEIIIGTVSRLVSVKGHIYLLEAAKEILAEFPQVKFLIVGDGYLKPTLIQAAKELGIEQSVIFTGLREDIPSLLGIFNIFVQPSIIKEGLPLAIAEAEAAGIVVVATDVGGNREIVRDQETGFLVSQASVSDLASKLIFLLHNPQRAKEMGQAGRLLCEKAFSSQVMIQKVEALYKEFFPGG